MLCFFFFFFFYCISNVFALVLRLALLAQIISVPFASQPHNKLSFTVNLEAGRQS